jgi:hypothetical protein
MNVRVWTSVALAAPWCGVVAGLLPLADARILQRIALRVKCTGTVLVKKSETFSPHHHRGVLFTIFNTQYLNNITSNIGADMLKFKA